MTESIDLKEIERRPTRYWNVDGLPELTMGMLWMLWGGAWLFGQTLPRGAVWNTYWLITPATLAFSAFAAVWLTKKLKERITFPRAGYVEWKEPTRVQRLSAAGIAMATALVLAMLIMKSRTQGLENVAAPGMGVLLSLAFVVASIRERAPHYLPVAGVALALGLVLGAMKTGWEAANWLFIAVGAVSALLGAVRLRSFIRDNPVRKVEDA